MGVVGEEGGGRAAVARAQGWAPCLKPLFSSTYIFTITFVFCQLLSLLYVFK